MLGKHVIVTATYIFILSTVDECSVMLKALVHEQEIKYSVQETEKRN